MFDKWVNFLLPETGNKISNYNDRTPEPCALKFLFYRGVHTFTDWRTNKTTQLGVGSASNEIWKHNQYGGYQDFLGKYCMYWYGKYGLYNSFWKNTINWLLRKKNEYQKEILFSATEIKNFDFTKKYRIGNELFFITEMDITLLNNTIKPAKCVLIKA